MRKHQVKPGDVDLVSTTGRASVVEDPSTASLVNNQASHGDNQDSLMQSTSDTFEGEDSISPFFDVAAPSSPSNFLPRNGPFDTPPSEPDLERPIWPNVRESSYSSARSISPALSTTAFSPTAPLVGSSSSRVGFTKAQMAASNPDPDVSSSHRLPPQQAPRGGFRRHEDAGRVAAEVEDLPPLYRPEWEADNHRRSDQAER